MKRITLLTIAMLMMLAMAPGASAGIRMTRLAGKINDDNISLSFMVLFDSLKVKSNGQLYVTPIVDCADGSSEVLPTVLVNGRNMHYLYKRGTVKVPETYRGKILREIRCDKNGIDTLRYRAEVPFNAYMMHPNSALRLVIDTCGCGHQYGRRVVEDVPLNLNPAGQMMLRYQTPAVTELPVTIHEGRARVQFEVDRTELHDEPYICRNGQRIDNREQLRIIDDSVRYALSDPHVEIASISVCGYASPESPYLHNQDLSTGRSRALAEYLAEKYNLPKENSHYDAVAENWNEFRQIADTSILLTARQRADLLELIDAPVYGPSDYDAKERILKTDRRFAQLYRTLILPKWFPQLRATEFAIKTRLKPMDDEQLAEVLESSPGLMSLNQMMRVARLYEEGSDEFNAAIAKALYYYPDDPVANFNSALAAFYDGETERAEKLLEKAGNGPEAENLRGVIATGKGDFDAARGHFLNAADLPEAVNNLRLIK